jgi:hypothetical protein
MEIETEQSLRIDYPFWIRSSRENLRECCIWVNDRNIKSVVRWASKNGIEFMFENKHDAVEFSLVWG